MSVRSLWATLIFVPLLILLGSTSLTLATPSSTRSLASTPAAMLPTAANSPDLTVPMDHSPAVLSPTEFIADANAQMSNDFSAARLSAGWQYSTMSMTNGSAYAWRQSFRDMALVGGASQVRGSATITPTIWVALPLVIQQPPPTPTWTPTPSPTPTSMPTPTATPTPNDHIAFASYRDGNYEIYAMKPDGSNQTRLTYNSSGIDRQPAWSPDGQFLVFAANYPDVFVMRSDGGDRRQLTYTSANQFPAWSPDGQQIAFSSYRDGNYEIYTMWADGSQQTRRTFTSPTWELSPAWSPDGKRLTYMTSEEATNSGEIWIMNADGSGKVRLTYNGAEDEWPAWSPDGQWIAFDSNRGGDYDIYVMRTDGSQVTRLTNDPANDQHPTWSPDGRYLAFSSRRDGNTEIYRMRTDGGEQTRLTNNSVTDFDPSWSWQ